MSTKYTCHPVELNEKDCVEYTIKFNPFYVDMHSLPVDRQFTFADWSPDSGNCPRSTKAMLEFVKALFDAEASAR